MHNEEKTSDLGIIAHLTQLVNKQGTARDYFIDRNNFINHCIKSKSLRLIASIMPVALTALWYFSLDIYRHLLPYEKQQNSIVLQHNDPYFIGIVFFFFFVLVFLLIALNLYSVSILADYSCRSKKMPRNNLYAAFGYKQNLDSTQLSLFASCSILLFPSSRHNRSRKLPEFRPPHFHYALNSSFFLSHVLSTT